MYVWTDELHPVLPLLRMGRGRMMGVDHNKGLRWVGASAALIETRDEAPPCLRLAVAAVAVATADRRRPEGAGSVAPRSGFLLFIPPILVAALYGGFWPAGRGNGARRACPPSISSTGPTSRLAGPVKTSTRWSSTRSSAWVPRCWPAACRRPRPTCSAASASSRRCSASRRSGSASPTIRECRNISVNPAFAEMLGVSTVANASLSAPDGGTSAVRHRKHG